MKQQTLILITLIGILACNQSHESKQNLNDAPKYMNTDKEIWTIYSKTDSIYNVKRLIDTDSSSYLLTYQINTSQAEAGTQTFIKKEIIIENDLHNGISKDSNYKWIPFKSISVLFVQIKPTAFKDEMAALDKRQKIEQIIDDELMAKNLGSWFAGDLGPGGANMLFKVENVEKAKEVIHKILSKENLEKSTIIGRRINTGENDWFYEVIYPYDFSGLFVTI